MRYGQVALPLVVALHATTKFVVVRPISHVFSGLVEPVCVYDGMSAAPQTAAGPVRIRKAYVVSASCRLVV